MNPKTVTVFAETDGERVDALLARAIPDLSRTAAQRLLESGAVTRRGAPLRKNQRAAAGDVFEVALSAPPEETPTAAENIPLDVVYEDEDVIVVNKPRGMVVHPAPGHGEGTLVNALLYHCGDSLSGIGGEKRPGIVHRIDKDTSGLIIAAKNDVAHVRLARQLADRSLSRVYEAVVVGRVRDDAGTIDAPIGRCPADRKKMAVTAQNSRPAVTHYEVIARYDGFTHIRCRLETGRTHQIRVHMAHIGHPLLGDPLYGHGRQRVACPGGQCLHARELKFIHPRTGLPIRLTTDLPDYFKDILSKLGPPVA